MRSTDLNETEREIAFARLAAREFKLNPRLATFGDPEKGSYIAIRWGLMDRGVLVLKLDADHEPVNFRDMITDSANGSQSK